MKDLCQNLYGSRYLIMKEVGSMKGNKWLGEIIVEEGITFGSNTMIIAPTGSGKTYYIFNQLIDENKQVLYLCDTNNLKYAINKDISKLDLANVYTMTYEAFGKKVRYDTSNDFINQFDMIICDEVHNLVDFQTFSKNPNLAIAQVKLFDKYEHTKIVIFTATPDKLDKLTGRNSEIDCYFKEHTHDFREGYDIRQYANLREAYFSSFSDIERQLVQYRDYFRLGYQALIFTPHIEKMLELEETCSKLGLRPISIWSVNADEPMNEEQIRIREHLLEYQELHSDYNVLIINRASETGINIENWNKDERPHFMNLVIIHSLDKTQQIQVRGRIRHDVDLLIVQTKDMKLLEIKIDTDLLDIWLTKETVKEFVITKHNIRDNKGRLIGFRELPDRLKAHGYKFDAKKKQVEGKRCVMYKISKIMED